jgi:hypothetical protein
MMRACVIVILCFVVSACVTSPTSEPLGAYADEPQEIICRKEKPTGSNRPVTVCRAAPGILDKEDTKRDMKDLQRQSEQLNR